jgi:hypothetical protein
MRRFAHFSSTWRRSGSILRNFMNRRRGTRLCASAAFERRSVKNFACTMNCQRNYRIGFLPFWCSPDGTIPTRPLAWTCLDYNLFGAFAPPRRDRWTRASRHLQDQPGHQNIWGALPGSRLMRAAQGQGVAQSVGFKSRKTAGLRWCITNGSNFCRLYWIDVVTGWVFTAL